MLDVIVREMRQKEEIKLTLFTDNVNLHTEDLKKLLSPEKIIIVNQKYHKSFSMQGQYTKITCIFIN